MPNDFLEVLTILVVIVLAIIIVSVLAYFSNKRDSSFVLKKKPKKLMGLKIVKYTTIISLLIFNMVFLLMIL